MTNDLYIDDIWRENNWMQAARGDEREEYPYLIITATPDELGISRFQGIIMYLKSERKGKSALYATCERNPITMSEIENYQITFVHVFPYTPGNMMRLVPDVARNRKIICYDVKESYAPLRNWLASHGLRYEMCNEFVDVKEKAKEHYVGHPDYNLDTIVKQLGRNPADYADDALGTLMKIKYVYEQILEIEKALEDYYKGEEK